ncbi:MAG: T9SS type A sorting domain-containing protein [Candidatus Zixiibacteriota bacterium]|nr:MAG: T9SS type A sorting domain-containing protein [candidate division Zixibacteria bacterium]
MKKSGNLALVGLMVCTFSNVSAQNLLNGPESVAFDTVYNRMLVSNALDGAIVEIDENMNQDYFTTGHQQCAGNQIVGDILYVTVPHGVLGFDLATADPVFDISFPTYGHPDGFTADTSGFLYVVDTWGRIIKIDPADTSYSVFVQGSISPSLQDIIFDEINNRILAVAYTVNSPIFSISLEDSTVTEVALTPFGYMDGINRDQFGNTYVSTYSNYGGVYRYDPDFTDPPELISTPHNGPAGLDYNRREHILAIPNFYSNSISLIDIIPTSTDENIVPDNYLTIKNYPNPFNAYTIIEYRLPSHSDVTVEIFDMLGRKVEILFSGTLPAGLHRVVWNAAEHSSGVYYYKINSQYFRAADRTVLLR